MAQIPLTWDGTDAQGNPLRWDSPGLTWDGFLPQSTTRMPQLRVLLGFAAASDHALEETAQSVLDNLYTAPAYPAPPVLQPALETALGDFSAAIAAASTGGPQETADKNNKRDILVGLLRLLAAYVQGKHGNNLATLLSSGFEAVSTNRASVPLEKPSIKEILNGNSGQLLPRIDRVKNAKSYEVRYCLLAPNGTPGPWVDGGIFGSTRNLAINGLNPGDNYQFQIRAVGGSTGYSDWSDPVSHRSL